MCSSGDQPPPEVSKNASEKEKVREVKSLTPDLKDEEVLIRGHVQAVRAVSKKMVYVVVRESRYTVQCVLKMVAKDKVSEQMVKCVNGLSRQSVVDVQGFVSVPRNSIKGPSQQVEIQVRKIFCVNRDVPTLLVNIEDADFGEPEKVGLFADNCKIRGFQRVVSPWNRRG